MSFADHWLLAIKTSLEPGDVRCLSPSALAYVGDAVYELYVRTHFLFPPKRSQSYHNQVVTQVRAESQAQHLRILEPYLTNHERELLRKGRNATLKRPKRLSLRIYQQASSLETLVGYLFLTDPSRLAELFSRLRLDEISAMADPSSNE
ncbi:MAG: Mini-ribonuclease 3 [Elainellaceae cyanobacterium]